MNDEHEATYSKQINSDGRQSVTICESVVFGCGLVASVWSEKMNGGETSKQILSLDFVWSGRVWRSEREIGTT